ncbi:hypothetical protein BDP55DRAFT_680269 [Colletotrichum godetiae]|uniref:Uncharacterized protein n=1 Tax=Colletotrichum godetiae TaxID=1209918 RepID=A0AAJ0AB46_9PEZI|nr:uncharacterized protein BDP55DRAFT_680269 [Colletotrichum godetiae]KAK1659228.1 hypothetical protein BDP55DRAFT_680269 [Colletotrichum godetiae]
MVTVSQPSIEMGTQLTRYSVLRRSSWWPPTTRLHTHCHATEWQPTPPGPMLTRAAKPPSSSGLGIP